VGTLILQLYISLVKITRLFEGIGKEKIIGIAFLKVARFFYKALYEGKANGFS
jgi:hypothetical protein